MNTETIALIIGIVLPALISIVKQAGLNRWINTAIAIGTCALAGFVTVWARGEIDWRNWAAAAAIILGVASTVYATFWRPSGIDTWLDNLTSVLQPGSNKEP